MSNHYQTLGVEKTATDDEIKKAYRRLAMKHHPDRGGDQSEFQKIQEAYAVLSDPAKRQQYDNPHPNFSNSGFPPEFEEIFSSFGGFNPFQFRHQSPTRNKNLNLQTSITLEEAFTGKELIASIYVAEGKEHIVNVKIPAGIQDGTTLKLSQMGDNTIANAPPGDVYLSVHVLPHALFHREGDNLVKEISLNVLDAIIGTSITIETLDKRTLNVNIPPGTQQGATLRLTGFGMPNIKDNRFRGQLFLVVKLVVPTNLTDQQKDLIRQIKT